ncbi:MAG: cytidylate kinase family protein [Clostridia bacterium]|nr:cytidylate kinase family protein [Clostridia bacterium]
MKKKHIITITGDHASGQGTLTDFLSQELGYEIYRNGQYARKLALDMGMSIVEFQTYLNEHPELDRKIEKSATEYASSHDNLIIDAKLGWYAVPDSFKVYLKVDIDTAARRAFHDEKRKSSENYESIEQAKEKILYRYHEENRRWFETYGIRREDMSNYDLVLDTTYLTPEKVKEEVKEKYFKWLEN